MYRMVLNLVRSDIWMKIILIALVISNFILILYGFTCSKIPSGSPWIGSKNRLSPHLFSQSEQKSSAFWHTQIILLSFFQLMACHSAYSEVFPSNHCHQMASSEILIFCPWIFSYNYAWFSFQNPQSRFRPFCDHHPQDKSLQISWKVVSDRWNYSNPRRPQDLCFRYVQQVWAKASWGRARRRENRSK